MNFFITHEIFHLIISLLIGFWFFIKKHNFRYLAVSIIVSLGLDIDHLFDYFHYFGLTIVNPITGPDFFCLSGKLLVPFHSWELVILGFLLGMFFRRWRSVFLMLSVVILGHLLLDQFSYHMYPLAYSFLYRLYFKFNINQVSWGCFTN